MSKRYLMALQAAGVPTVATAGLEDETRAGLEAIMRDHGWRACVLKPEIGASAHDTRLVTEDTLAEAVAAIAAGAIRRPVLVQPFVEEVRTRGEWSLIFIEGSLTHSVLKLPAAGDFRVQSYLGGTVRAEPAPPAVVPAAGAALAALPEAPLYARIDAVDTPGGALIMEVEVNEPSLFFTHAPPAAALRFAEALLARISGTATAVGHASRLRRNTSRDADQPQPWDETSARTNSCRRHNLRQAAGKLFLRPTIPARSSRARNFTV